MTGYYLLFGITKAGSSWMLYIRDDFIPIYRASAVFGNYVLELIVVRHSFVR